MSDTSEDEDLSRFREAVDSSFTSLIRESRGEIPADEKEVPKPKSERYLEESSHYNDVKVPVELQKKIGAKMSAIISKNVEYVEVPQKKPKKPKINGGVKLFKDSSGYLSCEAPKDTYTEIHNRNSKQLLKMRKHVECDMSEDEKCKAIAVSGDYILSKQETRLWKSRRKEKLFKYKSSGKGKVLTAVEL